MECKNCGALVDEGQELCAACAAAQAAPIVEAAPIFSGEKLSELDYFKTYADKKLKNNYTTTMVICFITAALCVAVIALGNFFAILDVAVYLVLGILMTKKKTWVLPLIVAIYGGIGTTIGLVTSGTPSGVVALVIAIITTIGMKKFHDEYVRYQAGEFVPEETAQQ